MKKHLIQTGVDQKAYPQFIFKYRADNDKTEKIITSNELWFSNPLLFNDPFDCNTPINSKTSIDDIKKWLESVGIDPILIDNLAGELLRNPNLMKEETEKEMRNIGICCFSTIEDSILQWSHYSDYHQGLCLKFDISEDPGFFMIPIIVSYRKIMQHYNHFCQSKNILEYLVKPKFSDWSYESEIRIVKTSHALNGNGNIRAFKFRDQALKEIIFGIKTPDSVITKYRQLCNNSNKSHIKFYKMELGTEVHYQLIKRLI